MTKTKDFKLDTDEMAQAGLHFGHKTTKYHPKMKPYLYGVRNTVHIIDLEKTKENFEEEIEKLKTNSEIKIYIGKENPFPMAKDFSIICAMCHLPAEEAEDGIISLLGPKRMDYQKNIGLINSLTRILERY